MKSGLMRFIRVLPLLLAVIMTLNACGSGQQDTTEKSVYEKIKEGLSTLGGKQNTVTEKSLYEKIKENLNTLRTYEAEATVKYISNNGSNSYHTKQYCKISGEYRVEVVDSNEGMGNVTIFDGKTIYLFNNKIQDGNKAPISIAVESPERSEIFLTSFVKNHLAGQEVTIAAANLDDKANMDVTYLDAEIPGDYPYLATERLTISNDTLLPLELVIYDSDGKERICVTYQKISYNVELDDSLFKVQ